MEAEWIPRCESNREGQSRGERQEAGEREHVGGVEGGKEGSVVRRGGGCVSRLVTGTLTNRATTIIRASPNKTPMADGSFRERSCA